MCWKLTPCLHETRLREANALFTIENVTRYNRNVNQFTSGKCVSCKHDISERKQGITEVVDDYASDIMRLGTILQIPKSEWELLSSYACAYACVVPVHTYAFLRLCLRLCLRRCVVASLRRCVVASLRRCVVRVNQPLGFTPVISH